MKKNTSKKMASQNEIELLSLVASRLKGRVLFPKRVEAARKYLRNVMAVKP